MHTEWNADHYNLSMPWWHLPGRDTMDGSVPFPQNSDCAASASSSETVRNKAFPSGSSQSHHHNDVPVRSYCIPFSVHDCKDNHASFLHINNMGIFLHCIQIQKYLTQKSRSESPVFSHFPRLPVGLPDCSPDP